MRNYVGTAALRWSVSLEQDRESFAGGSRRPSRQTEASEEARKYRLHFVWAVRLSNRPWQTDDRLLVVPASENIIHYVKPLSEARPLHENRPGPGQRGYLGRLGVRWAK